MRTLLFFVLGCSCFVCADVTVHEYDFLDASRRRNVPVVSYHSKHLCLQKPLVLINQGYGGSYKAYTYIAHILHTHSLSRATWWPAFSTT